MGTFPVILLKLAAPPLPPQTKLNFEQNGWKWVLFGHNFAGGSGGSTDEPKAEPKMVVRSRVLRNNYLEGLFHRFPSTFFLHCSVIFTNSEKNYSLDLTQMVIYMLIEIQRVADKIGADYKTKTFCCSHLLLEGLHGGTLITQNTFGGVGR